MFLKRWLVLDAGRNTSISLSSPRGTKAATARKKNGFLIGVLRYAKQNQDFVSMIIAMAIFLSVIAIFVIAAAATGIYNENNNNNSRSLAAPQHAVMSPRFLLSRFSIKSQPRRPRGHRYFDYWFDEQNDPFPWKFMKRPLSKETQAPPSVKSSSRAKTIRAPIDTKQRNKDVYATMDDESYVPKPTFVRNEEEEILYNDRSQFYAKLRKSYESFFPPPNPLTIGVEYDPNAQRALQAVQDLQTYTNLKTFLSSDEIDPNSYTKSYDIHDCPLHPPEGYPLEWNLVHEVLSHWPADDSEVPVSGKIHQGICVFDLSQDYEGNLAKALIYRDAEVPFVVRGDPKVAQTVERWNAPDYLKALIGDIPQGTETSSSGTFTYWTDSGVDTHKYSDFQPPTQVSEMTFSKWLELANVTDSILLAPESPHYYFKVVGCAPGSTNEQDMIGSTKENGNGLDESCSKLAGNAPHVPYLIDELPFYSQTKSSLYIKEPLFANLNTAMGRRYHHQTTTRTSKALNCRFGMKGVMATNHFDGERNFVTVLSGERRYVLASPRQCGNMALFPYGHPSARHSSVDWANPDLEKHPEFARATGNEVVLQAGDSLFLPSVWFHYIVSLSMNVQCNTRSGLDPRNMKVLDEACGGW